jgi:Cu+-exporting ATPase
MDLSLKRIVLPVGAGLLGMALLMAVYLGIVSLAESPARALELFWEDKLLVIPIILGFGTQVGLYTLLKTGLYLPTHGPAGGATTAASGGISTAAMVACCAHRVADVLPLVGLSAAAAFLANWKIPFLVVGLISNFIGIAVMLRVIYQERQRALRSAMPISTEAA